MINFLKNLIQKIELNYSGHLYQVREKRLVQFGWDLAQEPSNRTQVV